MKTKLMIVSLALCVFLAGCQEESKSTSSKSSNPATTSGGTTGGGTTTGGTTGSTSGSSTGGGMGYSCTGTAQDGTGPGNNLWHFDIQMAGHQSFYPSDSYGSQWGLMNLNEGKIAFQSDYRMKVRFKLHPQPVAPTGEEYCYGREIGQPNDAFKFQKIKFTVYLRDVLENNATKELSLGQRYQPRYIGPVNVDQCSTIIDYSTSRNSASGNPNYTIVSHVVEVTDIRSDSNCQECQSTNCQYENFYCPSESLIRAASCWRMTMQISTDYTQDFN